MRSTCSKSVFEEIANEEIDTQKELALLARSAKLTCSLARSFTRYRAHGKEISVCKLKELFSYRFNPLCIARSFQQRRMPMRFFSLMGKMTDT